MNKYQHMNSVKFREAEVSLSKSQSTGEKWKLKWVDGWTGISQSRRLPSRSHQSRHFECEHRAGTHIIQLMTELQRWLTVSLHGSDDAGGGAANRLSSEEKRGTFSGKAAVRQRKRERGRERKSGGWADCNDACETVETVITAESAAADGCLRQCVTSAGLGF